SARAPSSPAAPRPRPARPRRPERRPPPAVPEPPSPRAPRAARETGRGTPCPGGPPKPGPPTSACERPRFDVVQERRHLDEERGRAGGGLGERPGHQDDGAGQAHGQRAVPHEAIAREGGHRAQGDRDLEEGDGAREGVVAPEQGIGLRVLRVPLLLLLPRLLLDLPLLLL